MRLYSFGGLTFPTADGEHSMPVSARSSLTVLQTGAFDQDGGTGYRQKVQLSARVTVVSDIDNAVDTLLAMTAEGRKLMRALMRDGSTYRQTWAKLLSVTRDTRAGDWDCWQPLSLTFEQDYPYWLASADEPVYLDDGYVLDGSWEVTAGNVEEEAVNSADYDFTISNTGKCRVPRGYMLFEPRASATMSAITITNETNNMAITYAGSLTDADVLEIELLPKIIEKNASGDYANLSLPANQRDWMILEVGDNDINIASTISGTVDFYWQWSRHYL